jgi:glucan endo-1,3-alpha-glucosidase
MKLERHTWPVRSLLISTYAAWSPWFFTHFSYKNWIYKSETLFAERWNELIDLAPPIVELISWNGSSSDVHADTDYGESHYFYATDGALPAGSEAWVDNFDHSPWLDLLPYFIAAYKSNQTFQSDSANITPGSLSFPTAPTPTNDTVVFWYRPHPMGAVATSDSLPAPTSYDDADDILHVIALLAEPGTIVINSGGSSQSFSAVTGFNEFSLDFQVGSQSVELVRNGQTVACGTGANSIVSAPSLYNYNADVTKLVPGGCSAAS